MKAALLLVLLAFGANAQTRTDSEQDRTQRATARTQALNAIAAEHRQTAARVKANAIQDAAVVKDQLRQDKAAAAQTVAIAKSVKASADAENIVRDQASVVTTAKGAANAAAIQSVKAQSVSDREFMGLLTMIVIGVLFAIWVIIYRGAVRQQAGCNLLQVPAGKEAEASGKLLAAAQIQADATKVLLAAADEQLKVTRALRDAAANMSGRT